jgi:pyruvate dehydrogenase E2 component (dihydrolipoamide acetyltransferase)
MSDPADTALPTPGVKGEVTVVELSRQERTVARRSAETRATVPSVELMAEVDMGPAVTSAQEHGCEPLAVVVAATAQALRRFGRLNGAYRDGRYELYSRVNLGIGLEGKDATVIVTLFDADRKPVSEIAAELEDLGGRAGAGALSAAELSGATFTVLPPLAEHVMVLTPLVQPPQAAALAVGPVREVPVAHAGSVSVGYRAWLTLACDHRIVQTAQAAEFLTGLRTRLQAEPA